MSTSNFGAFVINLDSRPDRLAELRKRTRGFSIPIERFPAVTTQELRDQGIIADPSSAQACTASHIAICRLIIERNLDWALVLEDDVLPIIGFDRRVRWALDAAPSEAWIVQLGYLGAAGSKTRRRLRSLGGHAFRSLNTQRREQFWWGSHAYLASKEFARYTLEQTSAFDRTHEGHDEWIRNLSLEPEFSAHCFVHHPKLAEQSLSASDIGKHPDAVSQKPHGMRAWRRLLP
jgi:GR25 family glycosyltransferase involved in LPS biosynthesis